jgi:hypothetical protein
MCIVNKPAALPLQNGNGNSSDASERVAEAAGRPSAVALVPNTTSTTVTPDPRDEGLSRKRPLSEEVHDSDKDRKMARYSPCTSNREDGCKSCSTRRVRFENLKTFVPATYSFSEEERKHLWYGLDECAEMNDASKACVKNIRHEHNKDTIRHVLCVASQCSYSPPPLAYLQTVRLNLPDEARGLELGLLPFRIRQRRQEHVKRIIEVQTQIVAGKTHISNDEHIKAKALAIQSIRSSQASQLLAQLLARNVAADEQAAAFGQK